MIFKTFQTEFEEKLIVSIPVFHLLTELLCSLMKSDDQLKYFGKSYNTVDYFLYSNYNNRYFSLKKGKRNQCLDFA